MRTIVSWAWFRPSEKAWDKGARWYRCDIVGGGEQSKEYADLPTTARRAAGRGSRRTTRGWSASTATSVQAAPKIPCTETHNWRAVTTIKVGDPTTPTPATASSR